MNIKSYIEKITISLLVYCTSFAVQAVNISTLMPSLGGGKAYTEAESNLWILIDDSIYMWLHSMSYDPKIKYTIPKDIDGSIPAIIAGSENDNREIFNKFYSSRMKALRSSLNVVLFNPENKDLTKRLRIGYGTLAGQGKRTFPKEEKNNTYIYPFYGSDGEYNRKKMRKWLYSLNFMNRSSSDLRVKMSKFLSDIIKQSKNEGRNTSIRNPFLVFPGKKYKKGSNDLLLCRRNYLFIMSAGQWADNTSDIVDYVNKKGSVNYNSNYPTDDTEIGKVRTYKPYKLPDGKKYTGRLAPYVTDAYIGYNRVDEPTISSLALAAWKTDMDKDKSTDLLRPKNATVKINGVDKVPTLDGKEYWHPWNDPASWQHINTYSMTFGSHNYSLKINKPNNISRFLDPSWRWKIPLESTQVNYRPIIGVDMSSGNTDFASAALNSRGKYFNALSSDDMLSAFKGLLLDIQKKPRIDAVTGSPGIMVDSQKSSNDRYITRYDSKSFKGSLIKYGIFDGKNQSKCFIKNTTIAPVYGTRCTKPLWNAAKILSKRNSKRNIISLKRDFGTSGTSSNSNLNNITYNSIDFKPSEISKKQEDRLIKGFPSILSKNFSSNKERISKLFSYIEGDASEEKKLFRNRNDHHYTDKIGRNILGAIVRTTPVYAGVPKADISHLKVGSMAYKKYLSFVKNFIKRNTGKGKEVKNEVVYVSANDGMLHAFNSYTGKEIFAYLPTTVFDRLPKIVEPANNYTLMDGNISLNTVNFGNNIDDNYNSNWRRILTGTFGGGAKGLYSLDVTKPTADAVKKSKFAKWEYSDFESILFQKKKYQASGIKVGTLKSNVGNIIAKPTITQLHDNTWVAIVGNGYNSQSNKAVLIVINLETGEPIQEIELESPIYTDSSKENGLGPVSLSSFPNKSKDKSYLKDRAYAGDLQGNLWVFDLTKSNKKGGIKVVKYIAGKPKPLFTAISKKGKRQPITVAPVVVRHPLGYGNLVHFGTGSLFSRNDGSEKISNTIYAIWDDWISSNNGGLPQSIPRSSTILISELNDIPLTKVENIVTGAKKVNKSIRFIDKNNKKYSLTKWALEKTTNGNRGWKIDLNEGERAWQPAVISYNKDSSDTISDTIVYKTASFNGNFGSSISNTSFQKQCVTGGIGSLGATLVFNLDDASKQLLSNGSLDINNDGVIDKLDLHARKGTLEKIAVTGVSEENIIPLNSVTSVIKSIPSSSSSSKELKRSCKKVKSTTPTMGGDSKTVTMDICSSFSSWKEL